MHIDFDGPIPHSRVYRVFSAELEELKVQLKDYTKEDGSDHPHRSLPQAFYLHSNRAQTNYVCVPTIAGSILIQKRLGSLFQILTTSLTSSATLNALQL